MPALQAGGFIQSYMGRLPGRKGGQKEKKKACLGYRSKGMEMGELAGLSKADKYYCS